jgi:hypothetical protein
MSFLVDKSIPPDHVRSIASRAGKKYGRRFRCSETKHGTIVTRVDGRDPAQLIRRHGVETIPFSTTGSPPEDREQWPWRAEAEAYRLADQLIRRHGVDGARSIAAKLVAALAAPPAPPAPAEGLGPPVRRHTVIPLRPENLDYISPTHEPVPPLPECTPAEPRKEPEKVAADEEEWFPTSAG